MGFQGLLSKPENLERAGNNWVVTEEALRTQWLAELNPEGLLELEAFDDFLRNTWHKHQVKEALTALTAASTAANPFLDQAFAAQLDRLHRYDGQFTRRAAQALAELRRCQKERLAQSQESPTLPDDLRLTLMKLEMETNHLNALHRARKAGILPPAGAESPSSPLTPS